jgi:hypothetical protein
MTEITEETFCHDFDEIMDNVIDGKQYYIINTREGSQVLLAPVDPEMGLDFESIQLRDEGN